MYSKIRVHICGRGVGIYFRDYINLNQKSNTSGFKFPDTIRTVNF